MKVYIAGPMTGLEGCNFAAFHAAAHELRAAGHEVFNPAEMGPPCDDVAHRRKCLRQDLKALVDCEVIALLPGWEFSRGAAMELCVAEELGLLVWDLPARVKAFRPACSVEPERLFQSPGGASVISDGPDSRRLPACTDQESERLAALSIAAFVMGAAVVGMILALAMLGGCSARLPNEHAAENDLRGKRQKQPKVARADPNYQAEPYAKREPGDEPWAYPQPTPAREVDSQKSKELHGAEAKTAEHYTKP